MAPSETATVAATNHAAIGITAGKVHKGTSGNGTNGKYGVSRAPDCAAQCPASSDRTDGTRPSMSYMYRAACGEDVSRPLAEDTPTGGMHSSTT